MLNPSVSVDGLLSFIALALLSIRSAPQEQKADRWIEIVSPYINYPTASALHMYVYFVLLFFADDRFPY